MKKRKSLNDVIHGDRADIRGYAIGKEPDWDDFERTHEYHSPSSSSFGKSKGTKLGPACYESHPALKLPGTDFVIYGGSCGHPVVRDADVYIGFDHSMRWSYRHFPWKKGAEVLFLVPDMGVPSDVAEYTKLVNWTHKQLEAGLKVHAGCIGGHGRTGMFLAAVVSTFGEPDAINYVRKNYCHKAVESSVQGRFLHTNFGVIMAGGTKDRSSSHSRSRSPAKTDQPMLPLISDDKARSYTPVADSDSSIWG